MNTQTATGGPGILTKKEFKQQQRAQKNAAKNNDKSVKNSATDAMDLYRLQKRVRKPITFGKLMFWLLLFVALILLGLFIGFYFTVDRFDFAAIFSKMFSTFGWPDIWGMMFR